MNTTQTALSAAEPHMSTLRENWFTISDLYLASLNAGAESRQLADACMAVDKYLSTAHRIFTKLKKHNANHDAEAQMVENIRQLALKSLDLTPTL